ncbi:MAG: hydroxyacid dehydrogenase [Syntrophomonadaceae bacterium]|nr:hydroxyacid dehydrogenase [Syntrophomonadaceae bacterium]
MSKKVLLVQPIHADAVARLKEEVEVVIAEKTAEDYVKQAVKDCDGIIVRVTLLTRGIIEAGEKLKVIGRHGVGLDSIDVEAATEHHIPVIYGPGSNTNAVAEHAVALMLALMKIIIPSHESTTRLNDYKVRLTTRTREVKDKVIGVVGLGQIGRRFAAICQNGFDAKIIGYDPYLSQAALQAAGLNVELYDNVDDLLKTADIVSLHAPATDDNYQMINARTLALMKKTAYLINTGRGTLVDEAALYQALVNGQIAGAAVDVFDPEPPLADNPLFALPNVVVTPHTAAHSEEGLRMMAMMAAEQVLQVLRGERPPHLANPQIWDARRKLN